MITLDLKTSSKAVKDYYSGLDEFDRLGVTHETAVRSSFQRLLEHCCRRAGWTFIGESTNIQETGQRQVSMDGTRRG